MDICEGLTNEDAEHLQKIAMEIFVDCTNVGVPFQEAIGAVYLSGLNHGHKATVRKISHTKEGGNDGTP